MIENSLMNMEGKLKLTKNKTSFKETFNEMEKKTYPSTNPNNPGTYDADRIDAQAAIRIGDWKFIEAQIIWNKNGKTMLQNQLFNLAEDPGEKVSKLTMYLPI